MKIYPITNSMILILYHDVSIFLYKFSQSLNCLTSQKTRIVLFCGRMEYPVTQCMFKTMHGKESV